VLKYADETSLRNYLKSKFKKLKWKNKINILEQISYGLNIVHKENLIHQDLHSGNILVKKDKFMIADLGLSIPADKTSMGKNMFGVLPYVAPEVLVGQPYTQKSDVYSFGVLMSEISTGQPPFKECSHSDELAMNICNGLRPSFSNNTPRIYIELASRCMDADPRKRPTSEEIHDIVLSWHRTTYSIFEEMDKIPFDASTTIHPNAIYTSKRLNFADLPQPVNSNKITIISSYNGNYIIY